jgi:hypothetical protein
MGYLYITPWTFQGAEAYAQQYFQADIAGHTRTGWFWLNTEGGTDPLCDVVANPQCTVPDMMLTGSAGYSLTTQHFIQFLVNMYDRNNPRINWIMWTAGDWTNTPGASTFGALQPNPQPVFCHTGTCIGPVPGWGVQLSFIPINQTNCLYNCPTMNSYFLYVVIATVAVIAVSTVYALARRKRS